MQKVITFCSGKGGVGKSTVACCVAAATVCRGRRVLLVDADQGLAGLDLLLGIESRPIFDVCDVNFQNCTVSDAVAPCNLLAGLNLATVSLSPGKNCSAAELERFCRIFAGQYDYIFVDGPAGLGRDFEAAAMVSGEMIVIATPDQVSLRAAAKTAAAAETMGKKARLILNRYNRRLARRNTGVSIDAAIDAAGCQLLGVIPEDPEFARLTNGVLCLPRRAASVEAFFNIAARLCGQEVPLSRF